MKYMITWYERSQGSAIEYENAQKRILGVFRHWQFPETIKVETFLVRVGEYGGFMLIDCEQPAAIQRMTSSFPAFSFQVDPVLPINEAVGAELEAIAWRDGLKVD